MRYYKVKKLCAVTALFIIFSLGFTKFVDSTSFESNAAELEAAVAYESYVVQSGDSLWDIAENIYSDSDAAQIKQIVKEIKTINHIESDYIYEGQLIAVPCYSEPTVLCDNQ